ncbi:hypothetical protein TWF718_006278 [Orbilia javanica]|uniref:DUF6697 domain-containing protein n=1 Tax=Orbilia javanica TaxID=47235 RepID=A0AAN8N0E4_9PEZI
MGSSWRPSDGPLTPASQPDFDLYGRYAPHISYRLDTRRPLQTSAQIHEHPEEPRSLPSPICTTSRVADCYRPGESLFRSTPPSSPGYPSHWHPQYDQDSNRGGASPLPFGSEDGQVRDGEGGQDAETVNGAQNTPPKSPVKFEVPRRIEASPVKNWNILQKDGNQREPSRTKVPDTTPPANIHIKLEHEPPAMPSKPIRPIPTGPAADRNFKSPYTNEKERNRMKGRKQFSNQGSERPLAPIDFGSRGTYPNNVMVVRPRFPRPQAQKRLQSPEADFEMKDAPLLGPFDISELLKDQPTRSKEVRDTGCQNGLSSHSLSYPVMKKEEGYGKPWGKDLDMDVRDRGTSACVVSVTSPKSRPERLPSVTSPTVATIADLDIEILVSRIVDELKDKLVDIKVEKPEALTKKEKTERPSDGLRKEGQRLDVRRPPDREPKVAKRQLTNGSLPPTARRKLEKRTSRPRTESSDESEDEGAFQRGRGRVSATPTTSKSQKSRKTQSPDHNGRYGGSEKEREREYNLKTETLANPRSKKRKRVESPVTESRSKARPSPVAFSTTEPQPLLKRRVRDRSQETPLKHMERLSIGGSVLGSSKKPAGTPNATRLSSHRAITGSVTPRPGQSGPLPDTFWFQRYYNDLTSRTDKPSILAQNKRCFKRSTLSHYLGGNPRLTVSAISPSARISQIHRVNCVVAIKKEFVPIKTSPGEVIVVSSPHDFAKQLPSDTTSFPVFLERTTAQWEYMGTYKFDRCKLFSNKEAKNLQDKTLIDFWLSRMFETRHQAEEGRDIVQKININRVNSGLKKEDRETKPAAPTLCDTSVKSLAAQLVPTILKSRREVRKLTLRQVEEYFQNGTLRLNWNFLKPVGYDNVLYQKLSTAALPPGKADANYGPWASLRG